MYLCWLSRIGYSKDIFINILTVYCILSVLISKMATSKPMMQKGSHALSLQESDQTKNEILLLNPAGTAQSSRSGLDKFYNRFFCLLGENICVCRYSKWYLHNKFSNGVHSLVLRVKTLTSTPYFSILLESNPSHSLCIILVVRMIHSNGSLSRTGT